MASTSSSSSPHPLSARSMPTECLERIVYHAAQDHRVLSTLMQVNSTLFRIATPYLYREPFRFRFGDEFQLDWDTETWTRHLRDVRRAKLLLLYLSCTETVQTLMFRQLGKDKGKGVAKGIRFPDSTTTATSTAIPMTMAVPKHKYLSKTQQQQSTSGGQPSLGSQQGNHVVDTGNDPRHSHHYSKPPLPIVRIPEQLEKLLRSHLVCEGPHNGAQTNSRSLRRMSLVSFTSKTDSQHHYPGGCVPKSHTVNYLDYIEHLDLDSFLDTSIQVLFSSSAAALSGLRATSMVTLGSSQHHHHHHTAKEHIHVTERIFVERSLLRSTMQHLTTLSLSVATFVHVQRDLMEHIYGPPPSSSPSSSVSPSPMSATPTKVKNQAGLRTGAPLSQLSQLNISGLHAELKPKVLRAIQWFLQRHVAVYPGVLRAISFEGTGDATVNRRRQRNRNVIGVEPVLPGVVHFNHQYTGHDALDDVEDQLETAAENLDSSSGNNSGGSVGIVGGGGGLLVDAAGHVTNLFSGPHAHNGPTEAVPADFHSQYYLLSRNPDESCELDFMSIVKELSGQLELLDFSRWSWSEITQQALDMIPTDQLLTLRFHPRTRIVSPHGPTFLKKCHMLKVLDIQAFDSAMLDVDSDSIDIESLTLAPTTAASSSSTALSKQISLSSLSLTGNVPSVLLAAQDAIRLMGKSLDTIDLTAHLESYLSDQEMRRLMDWNTSLSTSSIPCLTTLQLHGHLAMNFNVPQLLELCPTLRRFGLTIKSYTSSSFTRTENAHVLPRFMVTPNRDGRKSCLRQCFLDTVMGTTSKASTTTTVAAVTPKYHLKALELEGPWILTERDVDQIGVQITGLVYLSLVGCRFYPTRQSEAEDDDEERTRHSEQDDGSSPVIRLVERVQDTLKTLRIHRRGLEGKPRRDSAEFTPHTRPAPAPAPVSSCSSSASTSTTAASQSKSTLSSFHSSSSSSSLGSTTEETPAEPVLAFKKRFPNVNLQIREKQHENSFVLAPPVDTLRRIHHRPPSRSRTSSLFSDLLGQPSTPHRLYEFPGQNSLWRRANNAVPFFKRHKTYTPNGFENGQIRSWGRGGGSWRRNGVSLSRFFTG